MSRLDLPLAVVTSGLSGFGRRASKALTAPGWHILMACRDLDEAGAAKHAPGLSPTEHDIAWIDLSSLDRTRSDVSLLPSGERVAQAVTAPECDGFRVYTSWGNRQRTGREAFARSLSSQAIDFRRSALLWPLTGRRVGLA